MSKLETTWSCSIRHSFAYFPEADDVTGTILDSDGKTETEVLQILPHKVARSKSKAIHAGAGPDPRRLRDPLMVLEQIGLLVRTQDDKIRLSPLGEALSRWRKTLNPANVAVIGAYVANALGACQLRNPTRLGSKYDSKMTVFPMSFIWEVMLQLENKISSDELNREVFRITSAEEIPEAVKRIRAHRYNSASALRDETVAGIAKNDRIIPWIAMASCGWLLIKQKENGYYEIRQECVEILRSAVVSRGIHTEFEDVDSYLLRLHSSAQLLL